MYVINHGFTPAQVSGCDLVVNEWQLICSQTDRIFDIANASFAGMTDADKTQFASRIEQDGSYQGYKAPQYWVSILGLSLMVCPSCYPNYNLLDTAHRFRCPRQNRTIYLYVLLPTHAPLVPLQTHITVNRDVTKRPHPAVLRPFLPDMTAFAKHSHFNVVLPILRLVVESPRSSQGLKIH